MDLVIAIAGAYLLGSMPGAYLAGRLAGHDIRRLGDGNVGAHNVWRHVGRAWGVLALLLDVGKGVLTVLLGMRLGGDWLSALAVWGALIGHNYPIWLGGRGGKGLAPALGAVLALLPALSWLLLGGSLLLLAATRNLAFSGAVMTLLMAAAASWWRYPTSHVVAPLGILALLALAQLPDLWRMWRAAPNKRDLILNRWIRDRNAKL